MARAPPELQYRDIKHFAQKTKSTNSYHPPLLAFCRIHATLSCMPYKRSYRNGGLYQFSNQNLVFEAMSTLMSCLGCHSNRGKPDGAEKMCLWAEQGFEKGLGPDHPSTLSTVNNLGSLYRDQRKLLEAEKPHQRALQGYGKALGSENIVHYLPALSTAHDRGCLHPNQGEKDKANFSTLGPW